MVDNLDAETKREKMEADAITRLMYALEGLKYGFDDDKSSGDETACCYWDDHTGFEIVWRVLSSEDKNKKYRLLGMKCVMLDCVHPDVDKKLLAESTLSTLQKSYTKHTYNHRSVRYALEYSCNSKQINPVLLFVLHSDGVKIEVFDINMRGKAQMVDQVRDDAIMIDCIHPDIIIPHLSTYIVKTLQSNGKRLTSHV